mmetsp:Transcript_23434/g.65182  ORF Transcript_23434/g.65182 Transcript_23434/m.65182 type:complete len:318 (+) Transcript_23434:268-1221(+)|eukprot:CAMPEP_0168832676 /NCGR_PEP_ID=MMETSP0727-20121128/2679_1 /TAXON_ID=265536 /ORGANISM="Amphiprora sp., Strain CCMP467" /LENGTH=317 /DNA_ID=CAMNT_0008885965 /DNA_START=169 /DNA_END=1122 /DNA_ORIENTATION=+
MQAPGVTPGSASGPGYRRLSKQDERMQLDDDEEDHQGMDTEQGYNKVVMQDDDDDHHHLPQQIGDHHDGGETSSLVSEQELRSHHSNSGMTSGIFRESATTPTSGLELSDGAGANVGKSPPPSSVTTSPISDNIFLQHRTRSSSWEDPDPSMLFQDEDDVDDVSVVRRYVRNRIPIVPAEFAHQPLPKRLWQSFVDLRTAARQRRAARLLNERVPPAWHCILTWCCDATDRGIALVVICVLLWLTMGWTRTFTFRGYWTLGFLLFAIRVSARTVYEHFIVGGMGMRRFRLSGASSPTDHHQNAGMTMSTLSCISPQN